MCLCSPWKLASKGLMNAEIITKIVGGYHGSRSSSFKLEGASLEKYGIYWMPVMFIMSGKFSTHLNAQLHISYLIITFVIFWIPGLYVNKDMPSYQCKVIFIYNGISYTWKWDFCTGMGSLDTVCWCCSVSNRNILVSLCSWWWTCII